MPDGRVLSTPLLSLTGDFAVPVFTLLLDMQRKGLLPSDNLELLDPFDENPYAEHARKLLSDPNTDPETLLLAGWEVLGHFCRHVLIPRQLLGKSFVLEFFGRDLCKLILDRTKNFEEAHRIISLHARFVDELKKNEGIRVIPYYYAADGTSPTSERVQFRIQYAGIRHQHPLHIMHGSTEEMCYQVIGALGLSLEDMAA